VRAGDIGRTLRLRVRATNAEGSATARSAPTAIVKPAVDEPRIGTAPSIEGKPEVGSTLIADAGEWTGTTPIRFSYQWRRCDEAGRNCSSIVGATEKTYTLTTVDRGNRLRVAVTASNAAGSTTVASAPTGVVQPQVVQPPPPPPGTCVPASDVSLPERLLVDRIEYSPSRIRSRSEPLLAGFHVVTTKGTCVRGALVYAVGVPFNRLSVGARSRPGRAAGRRSPSASFRRSRSDRATSS